MPVILEQIDQMSASDKMRLIEHLIRSISVIVERQDAVAGKKDPREEYFGCKRPNVADFIGYCQRFNHETRSTDEIMKELREGEQ